MRIPVSLGPAARALLLLVLLTLASFPVGSVSAESPKDDWIFLPVQEVGAPDFLAAHPDYDGRGVVIFVLDTGVDMGIPGLSATSTGEVKVIGARDFSGEGKIELKEAEWVEGKDPRVLDVADGLWLEGFDRLAVPPAEPERIWTGVFEESRFRNNENLTDIDDDGSSDGRWGLVVYAASREKVVAALGEGNGVELRSKWGEKARKADEKASASDEVWLCVVDVDGDGDLSDETLHRDYADDLQSFDFRHRSTEDSRDLLTVAIDLRGDDTPCLNFHYDDGGHGSHVSGMAAGFGVHGQGGLNGVAPGAYLYSLKIGNNLLAGGSTTTESMKKAYDYAAQWMEDYGMPCVINMSYGIGSEIEGDSKMGVYLDDLLDEHSRLVIVNSAGNDGPGISTVGLPAAADGVIAAAALFTRAMAKELYGVHFDRDQLYVFSSRGGEVAKPDVAAPGGASSTVPLWGDYDRYNGTSMASPMTTGSVACILSGLAAEGKSWNFGTIQRALRRTGRKLPGYSAIDVGGGVLDLPAAFKAAVAYSDAGESDELTVIKVRTEAPFQPDGEAPAAYWRGGWYPHDGYEQSFTISPRFPDWVDNDTRNKFYRAWNLSTDVGWIHLDRGQTYINGNSSQTIRASYSGKELEQPGLHVGRIFGKSKGEGRSGTAAYDFEIMVTIVQPYTFGEDTGRTRVWKDRTLSPGSVDHYFVRIPAGATAMQVDLEIPEGKEGMVRPVFFDQEGHAQGSYKGYADSREKRSIHFDFAGDELTPGVWEIVARGSRTEARPSTYEMKVAFSSFEVTPPVVTSMDFDTPAGSPHTEITVVPNFEKVFTGRIEGTIGGFERQREVEVKDSDEWSYDFSLSSEVPRVDFYLEMSPQVYNYMTDVPVNIYDSSGKAVVVDGFGQRFLHIALRDAAPGSYTLKVDAGLALARDKADWGFHLREVFRRAEPVDLSAEVHGEGSFLVVPQAPLKVQVQAVSTLPTPPDGFCNQGELRLLDTADGSVQLKIPVRLER